MEPATTAVLVIDLQEEYYDENRPWYVPDGDRVLDRCLSLLEAARATDATVVHARHVSRSKEASVFGWGSEYTSVIDDITIRDDEHLITKTTPGCFQDTRLDDILARNGIETVVCAGLLSFVCVDTTAREASARGYNSVYVRDATAGIQVGDYGPEEITDTVATVQDLIFSEVVETDSVVEQLESGA